MDNETANAIKQRSQRSNSYPAFTLEDCIELTRQIYTNFGASMFVSREQVAKMLGLATPSVILKISSCTQYNLLELKSKEGYKPSSYFVKIFKPLSEAEKREALIHCFSSPKLYSDLIAEFNNQILPYPGGLATVLFRKHSISEPVSEKAANVFIDNARFLNLIDSENYLKLSGAVNASPINIEQHGEDIHEDITVEYIPKPQNSNQQLQFSNIAEKKDERNTFKSSFINDATGVLPFNIPLKGRKTAQIIIPENSTKEDFDTIIKWVYLMKESYE